MTHGSDSHIRLAGGTSRSAWRLLWLLWLATTLFVTGCLGGPHPEPPEGDFVAPPAAGSGETGNDAGSGGVNSGACGTGAAGGGGDGGTQFEDRDAGTPTAPGSLDGGTGVDAECFPGSDDDAGVTSM